MRCAECGKRFENAEKICMDDEDALCLDCLEDRIWFRHGTEEIAERLGYEITRYKRIEKPAQPAPIRLIPGQVCMFEEVNAYEESRNDQEHGQAPRDSGSP